MNEKEIVMLKGFVKFPNLLIDEGQNKFSCRLCIEDEYLPRVEEACKKLGDEIKMKNIDVDEALTLSSINVKTCYNTPVYNKSGENIAKDGELKIFDGAKVIMKIALQKYTYKENAFTRKGVCAYLLGTVIIEQGHEFNPVDFNDFKEEIENEKLQF